MSQIIRGDDKNIGKNTARVWRYGINFRSRFHANYFLLMMTILLIMFSSVWMNLTVKRFDSIVNGSLMMAGIYFIATLLAALFTQGGKINGPTWSRDCIWFNGGLCALYLVIGTAAYLIQYL